MKTFNLFSVFLLAILLTSGSCKKDDDTPLTTVEYQITPMNVYFTQITYKDHTGNNVVITDPSDFVGGTKSISVSAPFTARLETVATSTTTTTVNYSLSIKVNGEVKQVTPVVLAPMATVSSSVEYSIQ